MIAGKSHGPHLFIVPIRSPSMNNEIYINKGDNNIRFLIVDLKPCKGVRVGDIGPKAYGGFATTDNGCKFTCVTFASFLLNIKMQMLSLIMFVFLETICS